LLQSSTTFIGCFFGGVNGQSVQPQSALQLQSEQGWNMFVGIPARLKLKR
jgi:hypothetical protein